MIAALLGGWKAYAVGGALALALIGAAYVKGRIDGGNLATADTAAQNQKATNNADKARDTVDACHRSGGVWDRSTGKCGRSLPRVP